jgi:hypothetical protein
MTVAMVMIPIAHLMTMMVATFPIRATIVVVVMVLVVARVSPALILSWALVLHGIVALIVVVLRVSGRTT